MSYQHARDVAAQAILEAGRLIRPHAGRAAHVREKGVHDLVTDLDEQAQRLLVQRLLASFPADGVLAEEGGPEGRRPGTSGRRWIIDPIDGTTNFAHGVPPYAVSLGLQEGDRMVVGVVYDVAGDELFTAVAGEGLYVNGVPARVSRQEHLREALLTTGFPFRAFEHVDAFLAVLRTLFQQARGLRRPGSAAVDLAYVAAGRFDGFFESHLAPWDVAAGALLVEEGGGRVTDYAGAAQPLYHRQIVATNGLVHEALLEALAPLRDAGAGLRDAGAGLASAPGQGEGEAQLG